MTEHVHEWEVWEEGMEWGIHCKKCAEGLYYVGLSAMLNEHAELKREIEELEAWQIDALDIYSHLDVDIAAIRKIKALTAEEEEDETIK